ncbi:MAG: UDP-N-acetylglucosamine 1-carboxyvinyltransferase [Candidatus Latescibacteria bacterium]|nr:UDP-N-acetylglucosamine 1-carboxyvinyltransferase [Candidatus Latescibacterota bacterium]
MDKLIIKGGMPLIGKIKVSNAKNATLPILAACLLTDKPCQINQVPMLQDIKTMIGLLKALGVQVNFKNSTVDICAGHNMTLEAPYDIVRKMRASYYVLGPLLARFHKAKVYLPGGCSIGPRPIDLHIKGMESLGAQMNIEHGFIDAQTDKLQGANILLEGNFGPSVGATANVMMAATLAQGTTTIIGAALEPEIVDLGNFLKAMGAQIQGLGSSQISITGVKQLNGTEWTPIPDRIEAGTFACVAVASQGIIEIENCEPKHLEAVVLTLKEMSCSITHAENSIIVKTNGRPKPVSITTAPYPGFPTDLQAQFMAALTIADGTSHITEKIFKSRFLHALELNRMGADIAIDDNKAIINGKEKLSGAKVMASDLRASAALVIAGLCAEGETEISRIYHLDRGYESLEQKLTGLGAKIERVASRN